MKRLPETMRAVKLRSYGGGADSVVVAEKPVPRPGNGQVLVRVAAAPVNPSDLSFMHGTYGHRKRLPVVPGFEGSGEVVAAGGGLLAHLLLGRRVACAAPADGDCTWAECMLAEASHCIPLSQANHNKPSATMHANP